MSYMLGSLFDFMLQNLMFLALHIDSASYPKQLSKEKEREYLLLSEKGDRHARDLLIEHNLRLVAFIVKKYYSDSGEQEDLISIGTIGLIRAVETFDSGKCVNFSTYASICIDNQIKMFFRKNKRRMTEIYMNEPVDVDKDGNSICLADIFKDPHCVADDVDLLIDFKKLYRFINEELDEREREIICKRYGLNTTRGTVGRQMTQHEIAAQLGISRSYVSRIEKKALEKLKKRFLE